MLSKIIFRQYDIRGRYGADFDLEGVGAITRTFASAVAARGAHQVLIGRDNRISSPDIRDRVVNELLSAGMDVIDIGEVISPMFYYACQSLGIEAGLMITASHNPGPDNGFKMLLGNTTIYGDEIQSLADRAMASQAPGIPAAHAGQISYYDVTADYIVAIKSKIQLGPHRLKVVVDCGNGTAGFIGPQVLRELGCEVVELFCESDPTFPNHHPDPVKVENCLDLIRVVQESGADLGIGFDGDGDRLGVVAPDGDIIWGDTLMILFWREILTRYPGSNCIVEVKCSQSLIDEIVKLGGHPIIYKTGHSLIKAKMKEIGAVFTGEMSGHMFFADEYYGYDDAVYAAARLLRILSNTDLGISQLLADVPDYYSTPEMRIKSSDRDKFRIVDLVLEHFRPHYDIIDIDGARILFKEGWGLVRASNTGPELIVRCEGKTQADLTSIKAELFTYLQELGLDIG